MNNTKLIYKAIALGYEGDPKLTSLLDIQDWIAATFKFVPCVNWDTKNKAWKGYIYDYNYEPVKYISEIKEKHNVDTKEATKMLNTYIKSNYVVAHSGFDFFPSPSQALYYVIKKALEKIAKQ